MAGYSPDLEARLAALQLELDVRELHAVMKVSLLTDIYRMVTSQKKGKTAELWQCDSLV